MKINKYLIAFFVLYFIGFMDVIQKALNVNLHIPQQWFTLSTVILIILAAAAGMTAHVMVDALGDKHHQIRLGMHRRYGSYVISAVPVYILIPCALFMFQYQMYFGTCTTMFFVVFFIILRKLQQKIYDDTVVQQVK